MPGERSVHGISGDRAPLFTTVAKFIRELGVETSAIFTQVLLICDRQGLVGRQMFAIDGVKLPSNADKRRSGTHAELAHEAERIETAVTKPLKAHRGRDERGEPEEDQARNAERIERLQTQAKRFREFLASHGERRFEKGAIRKSNVTDNGSAKMATAKGVIQGYTAVAAVDGQSQIIVAARAHGSGSEQSVLLPMVRRTDAMRTGQTIIAADAGYHSEANLRELYEHGVPALIADGLMRRRDERFAKQDRYKALPDPPYDKQARGKRSEIKFLPKDFTFDPASGICICPAGKRLSSAGGACSTHGRKHHKFQGAKRDCVPCGLGTRCLRYPERTPTRQVAVFEKKQGSLMQCTERMRQAIDGDRGVSVRESPS